MTQAFDTIRAIRWQDGRLRLLDQRRLPRSREYVDCASAQEVADAIRAMVVRGAPAIGIAAAYGVVLAVRAGADGESLEAAFETLGAARPTAVNLAWALARMRRAVASAPDAGAAALAEAEAIHAEDVAANRRLAEIGAAYVEPGRSVLTHCNTGALATGGYGTALGVIRHAYADGRIEQVYAAETRPWLQGSRLTAWELQQEGIPVQLIADSAAASLMRSGAVSWVIVGADRVAGNGDVANKIGTYALAVLARAHGIGFMVAAPVSTVDWHTAAGSDIPIEMRDSSELLSLDGVKLFTEGVGAWNPVFDVTPAEYVDVLVTEKGAVERPDSQRMQTLQDAR